MSEYVLQTRTTDTLGATMAVGASSCTLSSGNFGSPDKKQIITIDYNVASKAADFLCIISGTSVTSMTRLNGPDVEHSSGAAVAMTFVDEHYSILANAQKDGWIDTQEDWSYASATTITVPSDATTKYAVGDKIKLTQPTDGVKYFYVTDVASTVLTVTGGDDYDLDNEAITAPYYSKAASPVGFPQWFDYTPTIANASDETVTGRFSIVGKMCIVEAYMELGSSGDITGLLEVSLPIVSADKVQYYLGSAYAVDNSTATNRSIGVTYVKPNESVFAIFGHKTATSWDNSNPFDWAANDKAHFQATYEI